MKDVLRVLMYANWKDCIGEDIAVVCNSDGEVVCIGNTVGNCQIYCNVKNIAECECIGVIGDYIATGTFNDKGEFILDDVTSINHEYGCIDGYDYVEFINHATDERMEIVKMTNTTTATEVKAMEKLTAMGITIEQATADHVEKVKATMSTEKPEIVFCGDYADKEKKDRVFKSWLQTKKDREKIVAMDKAIEDRKTEKTKRPVQTEKTKRPVQTVKTAENVKKTTYDIALEKMTRMQAATKKDNDINRVSRYISDYLNDNGYTEKTKKHIATVLTPLAIRIVKNKLYAIQYRKDRTYSIYNDPIMIELFHNYRFEKIDPLTLHFAELITVDRQSYSFNSDSLKKSEQCTKAAEYTSTTIAADCVNQCILSLVESIEYMYHNGKIIDLLSCYIIPYNMTDKNDIPVDPKKWRYKAVNAINVAGGVVENVFADYEHNKHKSLDDLNTLYDESGSVKMPVAAAISDNYADIELNDEMIEIVKKWIDNIDMNEITKKVVEYRFVYQYSIDDIAIKTNRTNERIKHILVEFRKKLENYIHEKTGKKIEKTCGKKYIIAFDSDGKKAAKYESISAAAAVLGVSRTAIQNALKDPKKATCKGYTFDTSYGDITKPSRPAKKETAAENTNAAENLTPETPKFFINPVSIPTPSTTKPLPDYISSPSKYLQYCNIINELSAEKHIF